MNATILFDTSVIFLSRLLHRKILSLFNLANITQAGILRCFRDPIRVPRIENRVRRIREIGSLRVHTGYLTFSLKKTLTQVSQFE